MVIFHKKVGRKKRRHRYKKYVSIVFVDIKILFYCTSKSNTKLKMCVNCKIFCSSAKKSRFEAIWDNLQYIWYKFSTIIFLIVARTVASNSALWDEFRK